MYKLIVEKELRDILGTPKFAVTFGVCALLIIMAFFMGAQNYRIMQMRYEAAQQENIKQMETLTTDRWIELEPTIFMPPQPLAALVSGVSNDIGQSIQVRGRGELSPENSRYSDDTAAAVFRILDLEFVFTIVFSLFAILFCYNAVNGEKEQGTLQLVFSNAVPRDQYILGKITGSLLALGIPLLIPILIGCLLFVMMGIPMTSSDWMRLGLIILTGLLYFGVFLMISVLVSALTRRSSYAFIVLLVVWILAVLVVPRTAVMLAGRAVDVPSVDEMAYQKRQLSVQYMREDMHRLAEMVGGSSDGSNFSVSFSTDSDDPEEAQRQAQQQIEEFMKAQQEMSDSRQEKLDVFNEQLNNERLNRQIIQRRWAFGLARISPAASFNLALTTLAGTSLEVERRFMNAAKVYQQSIDTFLRKKSGMSLGGGMMIVMRMGGEEEEAEPIDINEVPAFDYQLPELSSVAPPALWDMGLLAVFNLVFLMGAYFAFMKYDVR